MGNILVTGLINQKAYVSLSLHDLTWLFSQYSLITIHINPDQVQEVVKGKSFKHSDCVLDNNLQ